MSPSAIHSQPQEFSYRPLILKGVKILVAISLIASLGVAIAAGAGWVPFLALYPSLVIGGVALISAIALCYCSSQTDSTNNDVIHEVEHEVDETEPHQETHQETSNTNSCWGVWDVNPERIASRNSDQRFIAFYTGMGTIDINQRNLYFEQLILHLRDPDEIDYLTGENAPSLNQYLQWLFPLPEVSPDSNAPVFNQNSVQNIRNNDLARMRMRSAFETMLLLFGLQGALPQSTTYRIEKSGIPDPYPFSWNRRHHIWLTQNNHSFPVITRILRFMKSMNFEPEVAAFLQILEQIALEEGQNIIDAESLTAWRNSIS